MKFQFSQELPMDAKKIREKVFVLEQGFENEFDDIDNIAYHLVVFYQEQPVGTARMFDENGQMMLGRIAVLKEYRHLHIGSQILQLLENKARELGYHEVVLSAQVRVKSFYEKNGYVCLGEQYLDEYCPHIHMKKII